MIPRILTIAGSDSGGGAGIQADIKAITLNGGFAMTAITALTAQNTRGVTAVEPVPVAMILAQIEAVVSDIGVDAVKIGMIGSAAAAEAVADRLEALAATPIIFDPVMIATSGAALADAATIAAFARLMALATVVTPNAPELAALTGLAIEDETGLARAGQALRARCGAAVLAKGGHLTGDAIDLLIDHDGTVHRWQAERIETRHTHGTGCTLASALATRLAAGVALSDAVGQARDYVRAALLAAPGLGGGHGPLGIPAGRLRGSGE